MPEKSASTRILAFGSLKVVVSSASVFGPAIAAPMPCTTRAPISHAAEGASPPAREATVNRAVPMMNSLRLPNRSPARPPSSSSSPPKARRVHGRTDGGTADASRCAAQL